MLIPDGGRTSYLGDVLAVVVADDRASRPAPRPSWSTVDYDVLRADHRRRWRPSTTPRSRCGAPTRNVLSRVRRTPGATSTPPWRPAPTSVHEMFQTQRIEHAFLEPESTLAVPADGRRPPARVLRRPGRVGRPQPDRRRARRRHRPAITVELVSNGGAFGGKEDMANQAQTALAAWLLQRPVKCTLSREESLLMHAKRHPIRMRVLGRLRRRRPPHGAEGAG